MSVFKITVIQSIGYILFDNFLIQGCVISVPSRPVPHPRVLPPPGVERFLLRRLAHKVRAIRESGGAVEVRREVYRA